MFLDRPDGCNRRRAVIRLAETPAIRRDRIAGIRDATVREASMAVRHMEDHRDTAALPTADAAIARRLMEAVAATAALLTAEEAVAHRLRAAGVPMARLAVHRAAEVVRAEVLAVVPAAQVMVEDAANI